MSVIATVTLILLVMFSVLNILDVYTTLKGKGGFRKAMKNWEAIEANPVQRRIGLAWSLILKFEGIGIFWVLYPLFCPWFWIDLLFWILGFGCLIRALIVWHNIRILRKEAEKAKQKAADD